VTTLDVHAILHELRRSHEGKADATTATLTLLAYCDDDSIVEWMRERARAIGQKHSARVVMLDGTTDVRTTRASATAGARAASPAEWIELGIRGIDVERLATIVHALTLRDVPTVLAWGGRALLRDPAFLVLNGISDSLILDSSRVERDASALCELSEYFARGRRYAVQDLAYLRLAPWQEMIALFFDDDELAGEVREIRRVAVIAGSQAEALYVLGWLASRLGWRPDQSGTFADTSGERIAYDVRMQGEPRRIRSVELESRDGTVFRAALQEGDDTSVCLSVDGTSKRPRHCEPLHDVSIVELIERSILMPQTSEIYRSTLEATCKILDVAKL
jgi:glucose-6-phosphate dehydrogenase assembly protein OpcA